MSDVDRWFSTGWSPISRSAIVMVCAASLVVVGTNPAGATNPGAEGRIAYVAGGELHVVSPNGTNDQNITPPSCADANEPHWAPDGSLITYINRCGPTGTWDISTIKPDGNGFTSIVATAGDDGGASFSPDGSQITYYSNVDGDADIYVADPDGTHRSKLTQNTAGDVSPTWSPDGSRIAFVSDRDGGGYQIFTMAADGSDEVQLTTAGGISPSWSPDGSRILFTRANTLLWVRPDGSGEHTYSDPGQSIAFPEWSPDATEIAAESSGMVVVMNADGTNLRQLAGGTQPAWEPQAGIGDPSVWFTAPDTVGLGAGVTLNGSLTIPGSSASGKLLHVYARPPHGSKSEIGTTTTDGAGAFSFGTTPGTAGAWLFEVDRAADASHVAAIFSARVTVSPFPATITLNAPKKAVPSSRIPLQGTLTITGETSAARTVKIFGTPPGGHVHLLGTAKTNAAGVFRFIAQPHTQGDWTYEARWPGTDTIASASDSVTVRVAKIATSLSLKTSRQEVTYGQRITAVVTLTHGPKHARVTISAVYGGRYHPVAHGPVVGGRFRTSLRPQQRLDYTATFDGDQHHTASQSNTVFVGVRVDVSLHMAGYSHKAGRDAIYGFTAQCSVSHQGCPIALGSVNPTQNIPRLTFVVQARRVGSSKWHGLFTFPAKIYNKDRIGMRLIYQTGAIRNFEYRVQVVSTSTPEYDAAQTPWQYFRVV